MASSGEDPYPASTFILMFYGDSYFYAHLITSVKVELLHVISGMHLGGGLKGRQPLDDLPGSTLERFISITR